MSSLKVKTMDGGETELSPNAVNDLKAQLRGSLLVAEDPGYDEARTIWNAMIDRRPAMIARCLGVADVDGDGKKELIFWNQRGFALIMAKVPDKPKKRATSLLSPSFAEQCMVMTPFRGKK